MLDKIKDLLGKGGFVDSPADMQPYLASWRGGYVGKSALVCLPKSTKEISEIVKLCYQNKIGIVPQCGNTGLVGGGVPSMKGDEIVINLSRMNNIVNLDKINFTVTVEAGCIVQKLQEKCKEEGLLFPISLASEGSCEVGGIISTNAGGNSVLRYGNTRDFVLGIEVVLPNGDIWDGIKELRKDNTGYDLKHMFIGAEGTLGIVAKAVFKLHPSIKQKENVFISLHNMKSVLEVFAALKKEFSDSLSAFEMISGEAMKLVIKNIQNTRNPLSNEDAYYVLLEVASSENGEFLKNNLEAALGREIEKGNIADAVIAESIEHAKQFWHIREHISEAVKKEGKGIHFDISVPISRIPNFMETAGSEIMRNQPDIKLVPFGHIGDGNIHYNMYLPLSVSGEDFSKAKIDATKIVYDNCMKLAGSISAEHGVGVERKEDLRKYKSAIEIELMRTIKKALDPYNIMNPGKML